MQLQTLQDLLQKAQIQELHENLTGTIACLILLAVVALIWLVILSVNLGTVDEFQVIKDLKQRLAALEEHRGDAAAEMTDPEMETPDTADIGERAIMAIRRERRRVEAFKQNIGQVTQEEALFLDRQLERRINAIKADFDAQINTREVM